MKHYYGMKYRSVAPGAQPKGMIDWSWGNGKYYAVIVYDRELTQKELDDYELEEVKMTATPAQLRAIRKYNSKTYDHQGIRFPKGELDLIRKAAAENGESLNAFIVNAVKDKMNRLKEEQK